MTRLNYFYLFDDMDLQEIAIMVELYKKCGKREDIFICDISLREIEANIDYRLKLNKDKISKILSYLESKKYITFIEKGKGRQKSIIKINVKDIINNKYKVN